MRNVIEEMCPSPVARRLRMKRNEPRGRSDWSGCGTMEGLNNAEASSEYSWLKYAPSNNFRSSDSFWSACKQGRTCSNRRRRNSSIFTWRSPNSACTCSHSVWTSRSGSAMTCAQSLMARRSFVSRNGRSSTRVRSGCKHDVGALDGGGFHQAMAAKGSVLISREFGCSGMTNIVTDCSALTHSILGTARLCSLHILIA